MGEGYPSFTVTWKDSSDHKLYLNVKQKTSMPSSVKFFKVPLPVQVSNGNQTKNLLTLLLYARIKTRTLLLMIRVLLLQHIAIDPDNYLISSNNKVLRCSENLQSGEPNATKNYGKS